MAAQLEDDRKSRLEVLKERKQSSDKQKHASTKPVLKFRNYNPQTEHLQGKKIPRSKPESIQPQVQEQMDSGKESNTIKDVDLSKLAPKKVDWDLKRDISKKMERLERRTQKAIIELIQDRLKEDSTALASAVATVEQPSSSTTHYDSD